MDEASESLPSTSKIDNNINPIDPSEVRRIVSGQAVSDLTSCVKELIDNALDAGAKSIQIRLHGRGFDAVEVCDDGTGIPAHCRALVAAKHATSKLRKFDDLYSSKVTTLGFRGEALFCLANIIEVLCVTTRCAGEMRAQKLFYKRDGSLDVKRTVSTARTIGTTVMVSKLFHVLPVRRVDFQKRLKSQRAALFKLLQGYAIPCVGTRFRVTDYYDTGAKKKKKTMLGQQQKMEVKLNTQASSSLDQTISSVLGSSFLRGLMKIEIDLSKCCSGLNDIMMDDLNDTENVYEDRARTGILLKGFVSITSAGENSKAAARDLQYFSINGRPVELPKISRNIADVWKEYTDFSAGKKPSCIFQLTLPNNCFDVNLSPNKREVLLTNEKEICTSLMKALHELWGQSSEFTLNQTICKQNIQNEVECRRDAPMLVSARSSTDTTRSDEEEERAGVNKARNTSDLHLTSSPVFQTYSQTNVVSQPNDDLEIDGSSQFKSFHTERSKLSSKAKRSLKSLKGDIVNISPLPSLEGFRLLPKAQHNFRSNDKEKDITSPSAKERQAWENVQKAYNDIGPEQSMDSTKNLVFHSLYDSGEEGSSKKARSIDANLKGSKRKFRSDHISEQSTKSKTFDRVENVQNADMQEKGIAHSPSVGGESHNNNLKSMDSSREERSSDGIKDDAKNRVNIRGYWNHFGSTSNILEKYRVAERKRKRTKAFIRGYSKKRSLPNISSEAESPNTRDPLTNSSNVQVKSINITKDCFTGMHIIGQFNLGFILAICSRGHLWILDQHACDERFNFERLCKTSCIQEQRLLRPLPLELSVSEEDCVQENMDVFRKNGFKLIYDINKPPCHRVSITAIPHISSGGDHKSVNFGKEDIGAILYMLGAQGTASSSGYAASCGTGADGSSSSGNSNAVSRFASTEVTFMHKDESNQVLVRLPKAVAMFASRACRSSIMIGTALSRKEMIVLVLKMKEVKRPWICAHGRPTMRHVHQLSDILLQDEHEICIKNTTETLSQEFGEKSL